MAQLARRVSRAKLTCAASPELLQWPERRALGYHAASRACTETERARRLNFSSFAGRNENVPVAKLKNIRSAGRLSLQAFKCLPLCMAAVAKTCAGRHKVDCLFPLRIVTPPVWPFLLLRCSVRRAVRELPISRAIIIHVLSSALWPRVMQQWAINS